MRRALAAVLALTACTGTIDVAQQFVPTPTLYPAGDAPSCTHQVDSAAQTSGRWEPTGPSGANITAALALDGAVLLGSGLSRGLSLASGNGGTLYRSTDLGASYSVVQRFEGGTITALVAVPGTTRVLAGVQGSGAADGVYLSTDLGASFTPASQGLHSPARVWALAVAAGTPERLYALLGGTPADPGSPLSTLYVREGEGHFTVAALAGVDSQPGGPLTALAAHPTLRDRLYLADGARLYVSDDVGATARVGAQGTVLFGDRALANVSVLRALSDRLLLGTRETGLLEARDEAAANWTTLAGPVGITDVQQRGEVLFVATREGGLFRSVAGAPLERVGQCLIDPSVTALALPPNAPKVVVAGSSGGAYRSGDGADTFAPASGLDALLGRVVARGGALWLLSGLGVYRSTDGGQRWARVAAGVGTIGFSDVAVDPADPNRVLLASDSDLWATASPSLGLLALDLRTGTVTRPKGLSSNVAAVAFDPSRSGRVFAYQRRAANDSGTLPVATGVFVSTDNGETFTPTALESGALALRATYRFAPLAVSSSGVLFQGGVDPANAGTAWRSMDAGGTRSVWFSDPLWISHGVWLAPDGAVLLGGRGLRVALRRSSDGVAAPTAWGTGLKDTEQFVYDVAFTADGRTVVGTQAGLFVADAAGAFTPLAEGFAAAPVAWSVALAPGAPTVAVAATNRGVYRRTLP